MPGKSGEGCSCRFFKAPVLLRVDRGYYLFDATGFKAEKNTTHMKAKGMIGFGFYRDPEKNGVEVWEELMGLDTRQSNRYALRLIYLLVMRCS